MVNVTVMKELNMYINIGRKYYANKYIDIYKYDHTWLNEKKYLNDYGEIYVPFLMHNKNIQLKPMTV